MRLSQQFSELNFIVQDESLNMMAQGEPLLTPDVRDRVTYMQHDFFSPQPVKDARAFFIR